MLFSVPMRISNCVTPQPSEVQVCIVKIQCKSSHLTGLRMGVGQLTEIQLNDIITKSICMINI